MEGLDLTIQVFDAPVNGTETAIMAVDLPFALTECRVIYRPDHVGAGDTKFLINIVKANDIALSAINLFFFLFKFITCQDMHHRRIDVYQDRDIIEFVADDRLVLE